MTDRQRLRALLGALEDPARAAALPPDDADLVAVARYHRLTPLLAVTCGDALPGALGETCRRDRVSTAGRNLMLARGAEACARALAAAGIPVALLKGLAYETTFALPPGSRPTSDVDLLVPNEQRRAAFQVMDELGFEPRAAAPGFDDPDYHEVAWTRPDLEVDLHLALAPFARCQIDYRAVWAEARPATLGETPVLVLDPRHATVFHALHMAIDHFDVPAIYLVDLARLLPGAGALDAAVETARAWRCRRPLATAVALAAAFLPRWAASAPFAFPADPARRVVESYGSTEPLPRPEQLLRKLMHFDTVTDAVRYVAVQARRNGRERLERLLRGRSARERLAMPSKSR
jgi:hypothetical protein